MRKLLMLSQLPLQNLQLRSNSYLQASKTRHGGYLVKNPPWRVFCCPLYFEPMLTIIAICIGASTGTLARWQLGVWLNPNTTSPTLGLTMPWGTLAANLIGGYLVGVCVAVFQAMPDLDPVWRLALVTGFLGALTTFSSFSAEVVAMLSQGRYAFALMTAGLHLFGSLTLTIIGMKSAAYVIN
jgi:fluoride exporter